MENLDKCKFNIIFRVKIILLKLKKHNHIVLGKASFNRSRCRISSEFHVSGDSVIRLEKVDIGSYCRLSAIKEGNISIGEGTFFNRNCTLVSRKSIKVGQKCSFGPNVCIYDHDHEYGIYGQIVDSYKLGDVVIGNNCWIGANSVILRNTTIGDNCVIGAGCVVKGTIPANSIVTSNSTLNIRPLNE